MPTYHVAMTSDHPEESRSYDIPDPEVGTVKLVRGGPSATINVTEHEAAYLTQVYAPLRVTEVKPKDSKPPKEAPAAKTAEEG